MKISTPPGSPADRQKFSGSEASLSPPGPPLPAPRPPGAVPGRLEPYWPGSPPRPKPHSRSGLGSIAANKLQVDLSPGSMGMAQSLGDFHGLAEKCRHGDFSKSHTARQPDGKMDVVAHLYQSLLPADRAAASAPGLHSCRRC